MEVEEEEFTRGACAKLARALQEERKESQPRAYAHVASKARSQLLLMMTFKCSGARSAPLLSSPLLSSACLADTAYTREPDGIKVHSRGSSSSSSSTSSAEQ